MSATALEHIFAVLTDSAGISDPHMNQFLMGTPLHLITIIALYFAIIYKVGPMLMKNRKPFSLRRVLIVYNLVQIAANAAIFWFILPLRTSVSFWCTPADTGDSDLNLLARRGHYFYILLKYFDLVETVFYVLRKTQRQISFLHVYHHVGILVGAWISGKYFPGGQATFVAFYNTIIHCIMYCYYLVSSLSPRYKQHLWWKKYVTVIQIVQHCMIFLSMFPATLNVNCSYPKAPASLFLFCVLVIIYLFVQFYKNTYLIKIE